VEEEHGVHSPDDIIDVIPVDTLQTFSGKAHGNDVFIDV
jgi:hypothetical protein